MSSAEFVWPVRVYYEDTDAAGVVYYANYLKFMERARTEWLRTLGFDQSRLSDGAAGVVFAVRSLNMEYIRPARFDDHLQVRTRIARSGRASLVFDQSIDRGVDDELLCRASVKVGCLDATAFRPAPMPEALRKELSVER